AVRTDRDAQPRGPSPGAGSYPPIGEGGRILAYFRSLPGGRVAGTEAWRVSAGPRRARPAHQDPFPPPIDGIAPGDYKPRAAPMARFIGPIRRENGQGRTIGIRGNGG